LISGALVSTPDAVTLIANHHVFLSKRRRRAISCTLFVNELIPAVSPNRNTDVASLMGKSHSHANNVSRLAVDRNVDDRKQILDLPKVESPPNTQTFVGSQRLPPR
jgi:hypothetical protein